MRVRDEFECPVDVPVTVLGGKWKLAILFYLLRRPRRTSELRRLIPSISQKMLTQQLRQLEADGLVERRDFEVVPPHVEYAVAEPERARLEPVVEALCTWGLSWADARGARIRVLAEP